MARKSASSESASRGRKSSKSHSPKSAVKRTSASAPSPPPAPKRTVKRTSASAPPPVGPPKPSSAPPARSAATRDTVSKPRVVGALPPAAKAAVATKAFVKVEITVTFTPGNENGIPEIKIFAYPTSKPDPSYFAQGDNDEVTPILLDVVKRIVAGYPVNKNAVTLGVSGARDLVVGPP